MAVMNFPHAVIKENCAVSCPAGTTSFTIDATLVFIEKVRIGELTNVISKPNAAEGFTGVAVRRRAPIKEERAATAAKVSSRGTDDYLWIYYLGTEREKQGKSRPTKADPRTGGSPTLNVMPRLPLRAIGRRKSSEIATELYASH